MGILASTYVGARAQLAIDDVSSTVRHVVVTLNKSKTFKFNMPIGQAHVGSTDIADVLPVTDHTLYIQGKKAGTTNVSIFDANNQLAAVIDLEVVPDAASLRNKIAASSGGEHIQVSSANGQVVLSGEAQDAVAAARAVAVAKGLSPDAPIVDAMKVARSQQVMLKVRILEVDRNAGRDLGVNWEGGNRSASGYTGYGTFTSGTTTANGATGTGVANTFPGSGSNSSPFGALLANVVNTHGVSIDVLVSALESKGLVKSLAEPDLIAISGSKARFLAGGQIPVPAVQPSSSGGASTITVDYKPYGVQLEFTPTVLDGGIINLAMHPEVTEIDTSNSVLVNGTTIPQLTDRSAETTVELRDGQSFAIAGLLQASVNEDIAQLPWLGNVPVLGALFRSTNFQKHETDLVIIVTPHLVQPAAPGKTLATPFDQTLQSNDVDLFLMGETERKKKYDEYVTTGGGIQGPYGHIVK